jgi:hypothetical protein
MQPCPCTVPLSQIRCLGKEKCPTLGNTYSTMAVLDVLEVLGGTHFLVLYTFLVLSSFRGGGGVSDNGGGGGGGGFNPFENATALLPSILLYIDAI